jgi:hypothetical protein
MSGVTKLLMILLLLAGLVGCASSAKAPDYVAEEYKSKAFKIRRVALATNLSPPEIEVVNTGLTRGQGAAAGAAGGAAGGAALGAATGIGIFVPASAGCGPLVVVCAGGALAITGVLTVGGAVVGAVGGAVDGTVNGEPADRLADAEANAKSMLTSTYLQEALLEAATRYGQDNTDLDFIRVPSAGMEGLTSEVDYKGLSGKSIDVVQEIKLVRVMLKDQLEMQAEARLTSVQTGELLRNGLYSFASGKRTPKTWMEDDASPLKEAIDSGLATIAEDVIDDSFPSHLTNRLRLRGIHYNVECPANISDPAKWFCSQADNGIADAQRRIGDLLYCGSTKNASAGTISDMDLVRAYVWYSLAASGNSTMAQARLLITQKQLSSDQLNEAQRRLYVWKPRQGQCMKDLVEAGLIK